MPKISLLFDISLPPSLSPYWFHFPAFYCWFWFRFRFVWCDLSDIMIRLLLVAFGVWNLYFFLGFRLQ
jgi:hypothetical protein